MGIRKNSNNTLNTKAIRCISVLMLLVVGFAVQANSQCQEIFIQEMVNPNCVQIKSSGGHVLSFTYSEYPVFYFFVEKLIEKDSSYFTIQDNTFKRTYTFPYERRKRGSYTTEFSYTRTDDTGGYFRKGRSAKCYFSLKRLYDAMYEHAYELMDIQEQWEKKQME